MEKEELLKLKVENLDEQGHFSKLRKFRHIYFAGAPDKDAFEYLKSLGVKKVIDLKPDEENQDSQEQEHAIANGIDYFQVPVEGCHALSPEKVEKVNQLVQPSKASNEGEDIKDTLVYCRSGNRASAWFAIHLVLNHGCTEEEAIAKAKQVGMDKEPIELETRNIIRGL